MGQVTQISLAACTQYSTSWVPKPPATYAEALARQQRLLHGGRRRSYFHLHRFVKRAMYAIISAAQEAGCVGWGLMTVGMPQELGFSGG